MTEKETDSTAISLQDLVRLLAKYPFAILFVSLGIFFAVDGSVKIGVGGKSLAIGPLISDEIRSILILFAGFGLVLGIHELFVGNSRRKDPFRRTTSWLLLGLVILFSLIPPLRSYLASTQAVAYHEVSSDGVYAVSLTSAATKEHDGDYIILASRRYDDVTPLASDPSVRISTPTKIRSSETDDRFAVQFESADEYASRQVAGLNRFECVVLTVTEELVDKASNASTIDALEELGAQRLRELHQDIDYDFPTFAEMARNETIARLTTVERSQLVDKLKPKSTELSGTD